MPIELNDHLLNDGTALVLHGESGLEDSDLAQLLDFTEERKEKLTVVVLSHTKVTGACLAYLACLPRLRELYLNGTRISDQDSFDLSGWDLEMVNLDNTRLGDIGIARLSRASNLRSVRLRNTRATDRGVQLLGTIPSLCEYHLDGAPISNHAKCRLDNRIKMAHTDLAAALRSIKHHIALGAQIIALRGPVGWVRRYTL